MLKDGDRDVVVIYGPKKKKKKKKTPGLRGLKDGDRGRYSHLWTISNPPGLTVS